MQKYRDTVLDSAGNVVVGAVVTVTLAAGGAAVIYSDNGSTVVGSVTTEDDGSFFFYAANGRYTITITPPVSTGLPSVTVTDILLEDPVETTAATIVNVPAGNIVATDVQAAIDELDAEKALLAGSTSQAFAASTINGVTISTPNAALNPNFDIAQRGTSFVSPASGAYDLDGWSPSYVSAAVIDVIQGVGPTTGRYSRQCTVTTADTSIAAGDLFIDHHKLTGYDIVNYDLIGNTFTVAFWAKFPITGIHCVALKNSGNDRSYVHEFNVTTANTWTEYQFTVEGGLPTDGTWNYTTGIGLKIQPCHACGSTYQTASVDQWVTGNYHGTANQVNDLVTVGNIWAISKLRINKGSQSTSHSVSRAEMLVRCQERLPKTVGSDYEGLSNTTTNAYVAIPFHVGALADITGIIASAATSMTYTDGVAVPIPVTSATFIRASKDSCLITITVAGGLTGTHPGILHLNGTNILFTGADI